MKILITGATGYIGKRLIPILLNEGHELICTVRDIARIEYLYSNKENITFIEIDFLKADTLNSIPQEFDVAFYLIHSMSNSAKEFHILEEKCARERSRYPRYCFSKRTAPVLHHKARYCRASLRKSPWSHSWPDQAGSATEVQRQSSGLPGTRHLLPGTH